MRGFKVCGLGFGAQDLGLRVLGIEFRVCGVLSSGCQECWGEEVRLKMVLEGSKVSWNVVNELKSDSPRLVRALGPTKKTLYSPLLTTHNPGHVPLPSSGERPSEALWDKKRQRSRRIA